MLTDSAQTQRVDLIRSWLSRPTTIAILIGLGLGSLFRLGWPGLPGLAALALWPAGMATGWLGVGFTYSRWRGEFLWALLIGGQLLGMVAIALFLVASIA